MKPNKHVYIFKERLNEWLFESVLYIGFFLIVLVSPFIYIWTPSRSAKYLREMYQRNWNKNYITEIQFTTASLCTEDYDQLTLGEWVGYEDKNNYYCYLQQNENVYFVFHSDKNYNDKTYKDLYKCKRLNSIKSIPITTYKGYSVCVKRSEHPLSKVHDDIKEGINVNTNDIQEYIKALQTYTINFEETQLPIKTITFTDESNLNESTVILMDNNISIYTLNTAIVNVHLFNELICSYDDISTLFPFTTLPFKVDTNNLNTWNNPLYIDYHGHSQCNKHSSWKQSYYNIHNHYTILMQSPLSSIYDTSSPSISEYYSQQGLVISNEPTYPHSILIGENVLYGLDCPKMKSISDHLKKHKHIDTIRKISLAEIIFAILLFGLAVTFKMFKFCENLIMYPCTYYILSFLYFILLIGVIVLACVYYAFGTIAKNYINDFVFYCEMDYDSGKSYANGLEKKLVDDIEFVLIMCLGLIIIGGTTLVFLIAYYACNCDQHRMFILLPEQRKANNSYHYGKRH